MNIKYKIEGENSAIPGGIRQPIVFTLTLSYEDYDVEYQAFIQKETISDIVCELENQSGHELFPKDNPLREFNFLGEKFRATWLIDRTPDKMYEKVIQLICSINLGDDYE